MGTYPVTADGVRLGDVTVPVTTDLSEITLGVRPEALRLVSEGGFELTVKLVEELGADAYVHGTLGHDTPFVVRVDGRNPPRLGEQVRVDLRDTSEIHLFHPESGLRIER